MPEGEREGPTEEEREWVGVAGGADVGCQEGARIEGDRSPAEAKERPPALSSDSDNVYSESVDSDNG